MLEGFFRIWSLWELVRIYYSPVCSSLTPRSGGRPVRIWMLELLQQFLSLHKKYLHAEVSAPLLNIDHPSILMSVVLVAVADP